MFSHQKNFAIALTLVFMVYSTKAEKSTICQRSCGGYSVQYPFGFSESCDIKLNCSTSDNMEIGGLKVLKVTSSSIFINLPAKCNRSMQSIQPLFSENFAPTRNNSLLVQTCSSALGDCVINAASLMENQSRMDDCHKSSSNIRCLTQFHHYPQQGLDVLTYEDVNGAGCKFLFSAIVIERRQEPPASLQLEVLELGWWLEGPCLCLHNADCTEVHLPHGKLGFRCQCPEGYLGDGFMNGTDCRRVYHLPPPTYIITVVAGILSGNSFIAAVLYLSLSILKRRYTNLRQKKVERLLYEATGNSNLVVYPYKEIERATNFFSEQRKLGSGAFGTVYVGKLHNEWVAVKKIKHRDNNSVVKVINEIKLLSSVSHPNLVRILGCSIEEGEQILILEFMPNGTLSHHLQRQRGTLLPWKTRLTIATETANAIAYLHSTIDPPIYHRDIKSSNILLDYNFGSKVADFGLSRLGITEISHISTAPQGTPGYVDPEYEQNFHLSDKSDVYSFGVVLVEIISALKVIDFSRPLNEVNLAPLAVDRIGRGCMDEIVDPFLLPHADAWTDYSVHKVAELAFRCLDSRREVRPTMMEVAEELENIKSSGCEKMEEITCTTSSGAFHIHENGSKILGSETLIAPVEG